MNVPLKEIAEAENHHHVIGKVMSENGHEFQCVQSLTSENCRAIGRLQSPKDEFLKMGSFLLLPSRGSRWEGGKGSKSSEEWVCLPRKEHTVRLRASL